MLARRLGGWRAPALVLAAALAAVPGMAGCADPVTSPSGFAPFSQIELRAGTGEAAEDGDILRVNYTGWLYDQSASDLKGVQFDSSAGREPLAFVLGAGQVIAGWDRGLVGLRVGGIRQLIIPPSLGYGSIRNGPIPPNATLLFEVELVEIQ